jgi:cytochrome c oxidase accessory protein FixG
VNPLEVKEGEGPMTAAHRKVYPRLIVGRFRKVRWIISLALQAILFFGPWIPYGGQQAIRIDLASRRLHFFWITFWPQDTYFLLVALIFLAVLLFASTAIAGRMWCGYACPQTLLTESFVYVETFFEGDRAHRMRLDRSPWTADKLGRKAGKYAVWAIMSVWLGITFAGYFQDAHAMLANLLRGEVGVGTATLITLVALAALFDFGWFREQMCHYACPYARFQGAMFDADSLIVGYNAERGEPRGKVKTAGGDCVDCRMCVQACPMGIDIRNGLQLECIACTACVDACDSMMDKLERPRGLVGYSSLNMMEGKPLQILRPRVAVYGVILAALGSLFVYMLVNRPLLVLDAMRKPGATAVYMTTADGQLSNLYHLKIINKDRRPHHLTLSLEGFPEAQVVAPRNPIPMAADSAEDMDVFVMHAPGLPPVTRFAFKIQDVSDPSLSEVWESSFVAPSR